jgi:hypothetical protein
MFEWELRIVVASLGLASGLLEKGQLVVLRRRAMRAGA